MPRNRPEPFWRGQTPCYYVQIGKKQVRHSPGEAQAWRLYHEPMARPPEQEPAALPPGSGVLVVEVLDTFLGRV